MRNVVLFLLGLVASLAVAEASARAVAPNLPDPRPWPTVETELKSRQIALLDYDPDVVFIGTSITEVAIDPDVLEDLTGLRSYNAALPFGSPVALEYWAEEFILPFVTPGTVVIGVPAWGIGSGPDDDPLRNGLELVGEWDGAWSAVVNRRHQLKQLPDLLRETRQLEGLISPSGHQTIYAQGGRAVEGVQAEAPDSSSLPEAHRDALKRLSRALRARGIDPVLMIEPGGCPPSLVSCPPAADREAVVDELEALAASLGLEVIDGSAFQAREEWFADEVHFNREGTIAFTEYLSQALAVVWP